MNAQDVTRWQDMALQYGSELGVKVLAAIAFWVIGRWLIHQVGRIVQGTLERQKVDATLMRYLGTVINVTLNILLVIGILGYFGIQTTTFAALFAAAGVAIVMVSSELPEVMAMSNRILVLHEGRQTALFDAANLSQEDIMAAATGTAGHDTRTTQD